MGIEEFMMYYGQQELLKIQKEEQASLVQDDLEQYENDEDVSKALRRSSQAVDINKLSNQIRSQQAEQMAIENKKVYIKGLKSPKISTKEASKEENSKDTQHNFLFRKNECHRSGRNEESLEAQPLLDSDI